MILDFRLWILDFKTEKDLLYRLNIALNKNFEFIIYQNLSTFNL